MAFAPTPLELTETRAYAPAAREDETLAGESNSPSRTIAAAPVRDNFGKNLVMPCSFTRAETPPDTPHLYLIPVKERRNVTESFQISALIEPKSSPPAALSAKVRPLKF
ncbi:MAG: hypothetical protein DCC59_08745 [Chloroflexi bacterium]|nr:MAG: hypothetical protein DCC59_08745 [Chloroflexota bacterium]